MQDAKDAVQAALHQVPQRGIGLGYRIEMESVVCMNDTLRVKS